MKELCRASLNHCSTPPVVNEFLAKGIHSESGGVNSYAPAVNPVFRLNTLQGVKKDSGSVCQGCNGKVSFDPVEGFRNINF